MPETRLTRRSGEREELRFALMELADEFYVSSQSSKKASHSIPDTDLSVIYADISRSVVFWDIHQNIKTSLRIKKRKALLCVIREILHSYPKFRYYQGLHDVCLVVLEVAGGDANLAVHLLKPFLVSFFQPFLTDDFETVLPPVLTSIKTEVQASDAHLDSLIEGSGLEYHFAIPWILTGLSHNIECFEKVCSTFALLIKHRGYLRIHHVCAALLLEGRDVFLNHFQEGLSSTTDKLTRSFNKFEVFSRAIKLAKSREVSGSKFPVMISRSWGYMRLLIIVAILVALSAAWFGSKDFKKFGTQVITASDGTGRSNG